MLQLRILSALALALAIGQTLVCGAVQVSFPTNALSLEDSVNLALSQGPTVVKARKTLEAQEGVVVQTRAILLPKAGITGNYSAVQPSDIETIAAIPGITFGSDQSWRTQFRITQSVYEGGRMLSSVRTARLIKQAAMMRYETAVADEVLEVQQAYFAVLLSQEQIAVHEASVRLLERELSDTTRRFEAGTVPRFNVLRAEVELANAKPKLSRARNQLRVSKNVLSNRLGLEIPAEALEDIPLQLSGKLEALPEQIDLTRAIATGLGNRRELGVLKANRKLRTEDVITAKSGYKPSIQGFFGYDAHSSMFSTTLDEEVHGWMSGVELRWYIFDGLLTQGKVREARAKEELAGVELEDMGRTIELQVRTAHSRFIEAHEVLDSQMKVLEQAQEALRLATTRSEAGAGTQLDVLSAQTALTEARSTHVAALHDYAVARAQLEHAMGTNLRASAAPPR
jgi:outer membrane protein TolC